VSLRNIADTERSAATSSVNLSLFRAPWLATVDRGTDPSGRDGEGPGAHFLIEDGAVCVKGDRIVAVGRFAELQRDYGSAEVVEYEQSILTPSLINAHVHLELSHLSNSGDSVDYNGDLPAWIRQLIADRDQCQIDEDAILQAGKRVLHDMYAVGTGLLADIGNQPASAAIGLGSDARVCFFQELLGMSKKGSQAAMKILSGNKGSDARNYTVHAPYSCHADLIRAVKQRSVQQHQIFPLHVAESTAEIEFLRNGTGGFRDLLSDRSGWDGSFVPLTDKDSGAVQYLDALGVLDSKTLCVHAVHVSPQEITLLAEKQAKICLCPGSNRYLGVGRAPVAEMLASGIMPALGTDSLASNHELNLWQEMKILRKEHPSIRPAAVFTMATRGGAEALGDEDHLGMLRTGMLASVLAVECPGLQRSEVFEYLTTIGKRAKVSWLSPNEAGNNRK
jgi:cytosine/adenosine deaminase-related metal-dependent hydrolase